MPCERPIQMVNPRYRSYEDYTFWDDYYRNELGAECGIPDYYIEVPCGKCHSCRKSYRSAWLLRLRSEFNRYSNSLFITLTFDDDNLKRFTYKPNRAVRLFLDRARKRFGKSLRHFIIGEFGEKTGRFHYHGILFNVPQQLDTDLLGHLWQYGFVYIGYCNDKTISYILKYLTKESKGPAKKQPPRLIVSKGLGESFVDDYKNEPVKKLLRPYLVKDQKKIPLPRYLKDKLYTLDELSYMKVQKRYEPYKRWLGGKEFTDPIEYKKALENLSKRNISLGLSAPPAPLAKRENKCSLKPFTNDDIRHINPYDYDFYSPNEVEKIKSNFSINETPF